MTARPLRIAFISPFHFRMLRGIERFTANLANQLGARGHDVSILAWAGRQQGVGYERLPQVRVAAVPDVRYFAAQWAVPFYAAHLWRGKFDVVNIFFAGYGEAPALRWVRRYRRFALNFIVDYVPDLVPHRFDEFAQTGLDRSLDAVIVKTKHVHDELAPRFDCQIPILPSGIDVDHFDPARVSRSEARARIGALPHEPILLTVAALEERKGIGQVLGAIPLLLAQGQSIRYLVAGEGPQRPALERRIDELGLGQAVQLLGSYSDVRALYRAADVFLLPAYGEAFPNAFLEAAAMELPLIVSHHSPFDEIADPTFALQVDERDSQQLANAVLTLLRNPQQRAALGHAGRQWMQSNYDWQAVAEQYLSFFEHQL